MEAPVYMYILLLAFMVLYPVLTIFAYFVMSDKFWGQMNWSLVDLLVSLVNGSLFMVSAYFSLHRLTLLQFVAHPETIISSNSFCLSRHAYCLPLIAGDFSGLNSLLFSWPFACALFWALAAAVGQMFRCSMQ